jgi:pimeloyl-ACP methyl ester carboxylesterase
MTIRLRRGSRAANFLPRWPLALGIALTLAGGTTPGRAAFPAQDGKVYFDSSRDGALEINSMNADGTESASPTLVKCPGVPEVPSARCGSIGVPLDRANPSLGMTKVAFALVPRRGASRPALETIVVAGPDVIRAVAPYTQGLAPLRDRRELLFVDYRGAAQSGALTCRALRGAGLAFVSRERYVSAIGACGRQLGPRVGAYGMSAAADDIDAVRAALARDRLVLWGSSFSTNLMTVYAARHPERVRSIVLMGAFPINFDPWALDRLGAARRAIRLVCARTRSCRGEAVLRDVARLAARLRSDPLSFTVKAGPRSFRARLDEATFASVVNTFGNAAAFGRIPAVVASAVAGDLAPLRRIVETERLSLASFYGGYISAAQEYATQCHDYPRVFSYADTPVARRAAYLRARAAIEPRAFWPFSPAGWTQQTGAMEGRDTCIMWPNDPTAGPPLARGTPLPNVPVLVVSADLDTNTPSLAGRQAASQFSRATFAEIPNVGHTPESSPCAVGLGVQFIATSKVNPRACVGTGAPPAVAGPAARVAAELPLVQATGTRAQRRALALVVATAADLDDQTATLEAWRAASGLRAGRYVAFPNGVRLEGVKVVRDASLSGHLLPGAKRTTGIVSLRGAGVPNGRLRIQLTATGGRATGVLEGNRVDLAFRV